MDRNLEQWLRGDPVQPETVGDSPSEGMADDVAALLGLPVALSRFKSAAGDDAGSSAGKVSDEKTPSGPDTLKPFLTAEPFPPLEPEEIQFGGYFPREDVHGEYEEPEEERGGNASPGSGYDVSRRAGEEPGLAGQEESFFAPVLPVEGQSSAKKGRGRKMAAAGMAAAAVAVGAYFLFGRESTGELLLKGREHSRGGNYAQALVYYNRAAERNPLELDALLGIAEALEGLDRKGEAVDAYYRCLQVEPGDPRVHGRLGFLLFSMSSYDKAIRSFQESVNFDPSNAGVFEGMGRAYEAKADYVQAVSAFKKPWILTRLRKSIVPLLYGWKLPFRSRMKKRNGWNGPFSPRKKSSLEGEPLLSTIWTTAETIFFRPWILFLTTMTPLWGLETLKKQPATWKGQPVITGRSLNSTPIPPWPRQRWRKLKKPSPLQLRKRSRRKG